MEDGIDCDQCGKCDLYRMKDEQQEAKIVAERAKNQFLATRARASVRNVGNVAFGHEGIRKAALERYVKLALQYIL